MSTLRTGAVSYTHLDVYKRQVLAKTSQDAKAGSLLTEFRYLLKNKPALIVVTGILLMNILVAAKGGLMIYTFKYYFLDEAFYSIAMGAFTAASILGAVLIKWIVRLFRDSNRAFLAVSAANVAANVAFFLMCKMMGTDGAADSIHYGTLFGLFLLCGLLQGIYFGLPNLLITNTIDYGIAATGKNQTGLIYGCNALSISLGSALGGFLVSMVLEIIHYVPNTAQSAKTLDGMLAGTIVFPVVLMGIHLVLHLFYKLKDGQYTVR